MLDYLTFHSRKLVALKHSLRRFIALLHFVKAAAASQQTYDAYMKVADDEGIYLQRR